MSDVLLKLVSISKSFPGVKALDGVGIEIRRGEIHSILGENGAGKSTLMKIISGAQRKDTGTILFDGREVDFSNTVDARNMGISMIYQEFNLAPHLSVEQNVFITNEPRYGFFNIIKKKEIRKRTGKLLKYLEFDLDPARKVDELNVCEQQITEIAKALRNKSKLIIMDEPTSALTDVEIRKLFKCINRLKEEGISILFISHNLEEVFQISDTISIMRDGREVGTFQKKDLTPEEAVRLMVGRDVEDIYNRKKGKIGDKILEVKNLSSPGKLKNISFHLKAGEVLGICGLLGAGRTELVRAVFGADKKASGEVRIEGSRIKQGDIQQAIAKGIGLIPEDRKNQGLFLHRNVRQNLSASNMKEISNNHFISGKTEEKLALKYIDLLRIKISDLKQKVNNLSGGNQQKVVLGKWLALSPRILLMDDPTRGIDIGAKQSIYQLIGDLTLNGIGIVFISSEFPEVIGISDRIIVISDGELKAEFSRDEATHEKIMAAATINFDHKSGKVM